MAEGTREACLAMSSAMETRPDTVVWPVSLGLCGSSSSREGHDLMIELDLHTIQ